MGVHWVSVEFTRVCCIYCNIGINISVLKVGFLSSKAHHKEWWEGAVRYKHCHDPTPNSEYPTLKPCQSEALLKLPMPVPILYNITPLLFQFSNFPLLSIIIIITYKSMQVLIFISDFSLTPLFPMLPSYICDQAHVLIPLE